MRVFLAICIAALAFGHPRPGGQQLQNSPADCSGLSGDALRACEEETARSSRQKRGAVDQASGDAAEDDDEEQEAISNEGAIARQGESGQYIYASDFGGPIAQILQHVYKSECCSCGCNCDCSGELGDNQSQGNETSSG